ncbi:hypothetical protein [Lactobacillus intestinalis]|nr:hypothetical protein [Lactobacillus intestinalis]
MYPDKPTKKIPIEVKVISFWSSFFKTGSSFSLKETLLDGRTTL